MNHTQRAPMVLEVVEVVGRDGKTTEALRAKGTGEVIPTPLWFLWPWNGQEPLPEDVKMMPDPLTGQLKESRYYILNVLMAGVLPVTFHLSVTAYKRLGAAAYKAMMGTGIPKELWITAQNLRDRQVYLVLGRNGKLTTEIASDKSPTGKYKVISFEVFGKVPDDLVIPEEIAEGIKNIQEIAATVGSLPLGFLGVAEHEALPSADEGDVRVIEEDEEIG
jgi:hypothetical protein